MIVSWTVPALRDLDQIQDHIAIDSPAAAYRLVNDLLDRTNRLLSANPRIGRSGRVVGTRELVVSGTAYVIGYRITDQVEILAVMHAAREWPDKLG